MSGLPKAPEYVRNLMFYVPGKPVDEVRRELGITDEIVKLASNENPLGPSPKAVAAITRAFPELPRYPDGGGFYLRRAIAERHDVDMDWVILGNGSTEIIEMIARAYLTDGEEAVFSEQSFIMYPIAIASVNGKGIAVPATRDRHHDVEAMVRAVGPQTKIVYIANPCNPTGTYMTRRELGFLLDRVPETTVVAIDQAYLEYVTEEDYPDALDDLKAGRNNVVVLRTFSKIYGLAGIRMGYAFGCPDVIAIINRVRSPFNSSHLAQVAGLAALDDKEWAERSRTENARELAFLTAQLTQRGVRFTPSVTNFVLVEFKQDINELFLAFQKRGVIIRPIGGPGLVNCARVTVGTHAENMKFLAALDALTGGRRP